MPIRLDMSSSGRRKQSSIRVEDTLTVFGLAHIMFCGLAFIDPVSTQYTTYYSRF